MRELTRCRGVAKQAQQKPYKNAISWPRCFRGIDTVSALTVVAELYGFQRFNSPEDLLRFLGLVPSEDSTGEKRRRGPITKTGNSHVRRLLVEAAWHQEHKPVKDQTLKKRQADQPSWVIRIADQAMHRLYNKYRWLMHNGKSKNVAMTAVAREMVGFIGAVLFPRPEHSLKCFGLRK